MAKAASLNQKPDGVGTTDFANKLTEVTNQLRLMEQKITMSTDRCIQGDYENHYQNLNRITYSVNKADLKFQTELNMLVPSRFTFKKPKKRL